MRHTEQSNNTHRPSVRQIILVFQSFENRQPDESNIAEFSGSCYTTGAIPFTRRRATDKPNQTNIYKHLYYYYFFFIFFSFRVHSRIPSEPVRVLYRALCALYLVTAYMFWFVRSTCRDRRDIYSVLSSRWRNNWMLASSVATVRMVLWTIFFGGLSICYWLPLKL